MFSSNANQNYRIKTSNLGSQKLTAFATIAFFSLVLSGLFFWGNQGLGFFAATILITLICNARIHGFKQIGFYLPTSWVTFFLHALGLSLLILAFDFLFLQPFGHALFNEPYQPIKLEPMRGNINLLYYFIAFGWFGIAFSEEYIFRGFFLGEFKKILGTETKSLVFSAIFCSLIVGLLHYNQSVNGMFSKFILSLTFFWVYFRFQKNLWFLITIHGLLNTYWFLLVYYNLDILFYT